MTAVVWNESEVPAPRRALAWFVATVVVASTGDGWTEEGASVASSWDECAGVAVPYTECTGPAAAWVEKEL